MKFLEISLVIGMHEHAFRSLSILSLRTKQKAIYVDNMDWIKLLQSGSMKESNYNTQVPGSMHIQHGDIHIIIIITSHHNTSFVINEKIDERPLLQLFII